MVVAVKKGRQVIIVDGTGRAADAIANLVSDTPDESVWDKITKDMNVAACKDIVCLSPFLKEMLPLFTCLLMFVS
jgi:hypothetical protein